VPPRRHRDRPRLRCQRSSRGTRANPSGSPIRAARRRTRANDGRCRRRSTRCARGGAARGAR
jgi:hypothetical protein